MVVYLVKVGWVGVHFLSIWMVVVVVLDSQFTLRDVGHKVGLSRGEKALVGVVIVTVASMQVAWMQVAMVKVLLVQRSVGCVSVVLVFAVVLIVEVVMSHKVVVSVEVVVSIEFMISIVLIVIEAMIEVMVEDLMRLILVRSVSMVVWLG